jgi:hypothetical protein
MPRESPRWLAARRSRPSPLESSSSLPAPLHAGAALLPPLVGFSARNTCANVIQGSSAVPRSRRKAAPRLPSAAPRRHCSAQRSRSARPRLAWPGFAASTATIAALFLTVSRAGTLYVLYARSASTGTVISVLYVYLPGFFLRAFAHGQGLVSNVNAYDRRRRISLGVAHQPAFGSSLPPGRHVACVARWFAGAGVKPRRAARDCRLEVRARVCAHVEDGRLTRSSTE